MSETGGAKVGRLIASDAELARILAALDATLSRPGRFVVVAGEPGVGKTRLAQEVLARVSERGGSRPRSSRSSSAGPS